MTSVMIAIQDVNAAATHVNVTTLKLAPVRLLVFLQGAAEPAIRGQLAAVGWSEDHVTEGWALLVSLRDTSVIAAPAPNDAAAAMRACEEWQATSLVRIRTLLQMTHPDQATSLFRGLSPRKGYGAVLEVATFIERSHALDPSARATIERAGATEERLRELKSMVDSVREAMSARVEPDRETEASQLEAMRKIWIWITGWSEIARRTITRRDQRIRLGIAKRRATKSAPRAAA